MEKQKAIDVLQKQIDAIEPLKSKVRFSPEYKKWRRDTEIAIERIFGKDGRHLDDFKKIRYILAVYTLSITNKEKEEKFRKGLDNAREVLKSMVDEIEEWGIGENAQNVVNKGDKDNEKFSHKYPMISKIIIGVLVLVIGGLILHVITRGNKGGPDLSENTRQLLSPSERPVLVVTDSKSTISKENGKTDTVLLEIRFENIGKHPARNLKTVIWLIPNTHTSQPEYINMNQKLFANIIYPGTNFGWQCSLPLKSPAPNMSWGNGFLFCIGFNYHNDYTYKRYPSEYLYYVYYAKDNIISHADIGERDIMNKHLKPGMEKWLVE